MTEPVIPERRYCPDCGNTTYGECCPEYWAARDQLESTEAKLGTAESLVRDLARALQENRAYVQEWADHWSTREQVGIVGTVRNSLNEIDRALSRIPKELK